MRSAHDVSEGGLAVALAECCITADGPRLGGRFDLGEARRPDVLLFSETPSRMIVTTPETQQLEQSCRKAGVPSRALGVVGGDRLALAADGRDLLDLPLARLHQEWMSLEARLETGK